MFEELTPFSDGPYGCSCIIGKGSCPRFSIGENSSTTFSASSSSGSNNAYFIRMDTVSIISTHTPLPITQSLMRLAQYSFRHHSTRRRRVSRPTVPPSSSVSLLNELVEGAG